MNTEINNLPGELLVLIFEKCDLLEKLKLRLVCLKCKRIIEGLKIKELSIVDSWFNKSDKWDSVGFESINYQNLIYYWNSSFYQRFFSLFAIESGNLSGSLLLVSKHQMFSRVKLMFISLNSIENFCFQKYINPYFTELEQIFCCDLNLRRTCLSLPNLKVLSLFTRSSPVGISIRLELPNVYKLLTNLKLDLFEFVYPQSVTQLLSHDDHESIARLSNLEYFSCSNFDHESVTLFNLPKLKEIHYSLQLQEEETKQRLDSLYQAKQRLGRYELKMFVQEVDYETYRRCSTFPFTSKEVIKNYMSGKMVSSPIFPLAWSLVPSHHLSSNRNPNKVLHLILTACKSQSKFWIQNSSETPQ